jgi:CheY-like chemotaxis protein
MENGNQLRILVVDDVQTIRMHTRSILESEGYHINEAVNGLDALEEIRRNNPHLVLIDIVMPLMDGITCCRRIKMDPEINHTKVIMVTGTGEYGKVAEAFQAGCDDYITKPIDRNELSRKVKELCGYVLCRQKLKSCRIKEDPIPRPKKGNR